jgi:lipopolysaccharide transport system ATP-binding protein
MLGLSPAYMCQREEEIVSFADIGEFIDYPVRTYSAGMQIRLAFAISTAVSGDILLLDEVIGVGDANFMKKAKKRIQELITKSEILLLASQDMTILGTFCQRGLVFSHGEIVFDGPIQEAISLYDEKEKNTESAKDAP